MSVMPNRPTHDGVRHVLERPGVRGEVRFAVLVDQFLRCAVQVHLLRSGTLDPLAATILETLRRLGPMAFQELCAHIGLTSAAGVRVAAEALHVLERAQGVTIAGSTIHGHDREWGQSQFLTAHEDIFFLPASTERRRAMPKEEPRRTLDKGKLSEYRATYPDVPVYQPNWSELYAEEAIETALGKSYSRPFGWTVGSLLDEFNRNEVLQRSRLQSRGDRVIAVAVSASRLTRRCRLHRCYLYRTVVPGGSQWTPLVLQYGTGRVVNSYSALLAAAFKAAPSIFDELYAVTCPVVVVT
jgi:hypothetical protein